VDVLLLDFGEVRGEGDGCHREYACNKAGDLAANGWMVLLVSCMAWRYPGTNRAALKTKLNSLVGLHPLLAIHRMWQISG
jgi:hypothetical protein